MIYNTNKMEKAIMYRGKSFFMEFFIVSKQNSWRA